MTAAAMTEDQLLDALRGGDEQAFGHLVASHNAAMLRLARNYVSCAATAEEVVQETWVGVINGLHGFRGSSSLKTWIYRILINRAMSRGKRDKRMVPFSSLMPASEGADEGYTPDRFRPTGIGRHRRARSRRQLTEWRCWSSGRACARPWSICPSVNRSS